MTIGTSIVLIAIGAILKYAVTAEVDWIDIQTVGVILMIVGILGLILSLLYTFVWSRQSQPPPRARPATTSPRAATSRRDGANLSYSTTGARRTGLRGRLGLPPTVEPDPGNAGAGSRRDDPLRRRLFDTRRMHAAPQQDALRRRRRRRRRDRPGVRVADRRSAACRCACSSASEPGAGASGVAAGMLAPVTEAEFGEQALLALNLASAERWPAFAAS